MVYARGMSAAAREQRRKASALGIEGTGWDMGQAVRFSVRPRALHHRTDAGGGRRRDAARRRRETVNRTEPRRRTGMAKPEMSDTSTPIGPAAARGHRGDPARRARGARSLHGGAPPGDRFRLRRAGVSGRQGRPQGCRCRVGRAGTLHRRHARSRIRGGGRARDLRGGGPGAGAAAGYASHADAGDAPPGRDLSRAAARGRDDLPRSRAQPRTCCSPPT